MSRALKMDQLEQHMGMCLASEDETVLEITTYKKPIGKGIYLRINRATQWRDGYESGSAMHEPLLEVFQSTAKGEPWKQDVLRIVYRENGRTWWHVQERVWRDRFRDPFKARWKVAKRSEHMSLPASTKSKRVLPWPINEPARTLSQLATASKRQRKLPWALKDQARQRPTLRSKGKRNLPWATDKPAEKCRRSAGVKCFAILAKKPWTPGVDTVSAWFQSKRQVVPDDEEAPIGFAVKMEGEHGSRKGL